MKKNQKRNIKEKKRINRNKEQKESGWQKKKNAYWKGKRTATIMEEGEKNRNEKSRKYRKTFSFFLFLSFLIFKVLLKTALWLTKDLWAQGNWIPKPKILPVTLWKETLSININLAAFLCPPPPPQKKESQMSLQTAQLWPNV